MEIPQLNYGDFYKFCVSVGTVLVFIGAILIYKTNSLILSISNPSWKLHSLKIPWWIISGLGFSLIFWGGNRWRNNQRYLDRILKARTTLIEKATEETVPTYIHKTKAGKPQVEYKIDSVFPGTVKFDFKKDYRVWFMVQNLDDEHYKVYFKMHFLINKIEFAVEEEGLYGGVQPWNLNAHTMGYYPGLGMPPIARDAYERGEGTFQIRIDCEIRDKHDKVLDKRLQVGYSYHEGNDNWYFEP